MESKEDILSQHPPRRRFLVCAAAGVASLALADMVSAMEASLPTPDIARRRSPLSGLSDVLSGTQGSMKVVNYATYVQDGGRVGAARAEHQIYADALREHDRLAIGGPLVDDNGQSRGVLLVYEVASKQQAETLVRRDPFVVHGAIVDYRLDEWTVLNCNVELLTASLVAAENRVALKESHARAAAVDSGICPARTYVNYTRYVADRSRVERATPAHRSYARTLKANGTLIIAGPFADDSGALLIYRARSKQDATALVLGDPYHAAGVVETYELWEWREFGLNVGLLQDS
ncbi:YciI family protein [Paraburkholderia xenovorans]|uniref:YciI family protein n=1 Tax=Paraburkholderia xenovorans TaxID=36873 RepID=UPI0038BAABF6